MKESASTQRRAVDLIVIHCSDTPDGRRTTVEDIDRWHAERGFARSAQWRKRCNPDLAAVGYHFVIYVNGAIATGRDLDEVGAHVRGYNSTSVGVCMVGRSRFTRIAWAALAANIRALLKRYPAAAVKGHRELDMTKTCPGFDVRGWLLRDMVPDEGHVLSLAGAA
jgi:N-acetyl-anhydromuramyl-L-alanine amidase AmpD